MSQPRGLLKGKGLVIGSARQQVLLNNEARLMNESIGVMVEETHAAAQVLQQAQTSVVSVETQVKEKLQELQLIKSDISLASGVLALTQSETEKAKEELLDLGKKRDVVNTAISVGSAKVLNLESTINKNNENVRVLELKIVDIERDLSDVVKKNSHSEVERSKLEERIQFLKSRADKFKERGNAAKIIYEETLSTIEQAASQFRVYERRIAKLSKETGYIIGYPQLMRK